MKKGLESLRAAVSRDCVEAGGTLHEDGCCRVSAEMRDNSGSLCYKQEGGCAKCSHDYCNKFKWVLERAQHYADKLGIDRDGLLASWEEDRSYWYMNYYQDSNQPLIAGDKVRVFDTVEDFRAALGNIEFRCPACGGVSKSPYECNSGIATKGKVCDWKVYGLFGDMGKGVYVFCKDKLKGETMFMPLAWESEA